MSILKLDSKIKVWNSKFKVGILKICFLQCGTYTLPYKMFGVIISIQNAFCSTRQVTNESFFVLCFRLALFEVGQIIFFPKKWANTVKFKELRAVLVIFCPVYEWLLNKIARNKCNIYLHKNTKKLRMYKEIPEKLSQR